MATLNTTKKRDYRSQAVEPGIRIKQGGYEAHVKYAGLQRSRRFGFDTPLDEIRTWRVGTRAAVSAYVSPPRVEQPAPVSAVVKSESDGYCYIYFFACGEQIKIGRALDPKARLSALQVASPEPVTMIGAFLAHYTIEAAIHAAFSYLRMSGELFRVDQALHNYITQTVVDGRNPVTALWEMERTIRPTNRWVERRNRQSKIDRLRV